jgi:hypothetical protein
LASTKPMDTGAPFLGCSLGRCLDRPLVSAVAYSPIIHVGKLENGVEFPMNRLFAPK